MRNIRLTKQTLSKNEGILDKLWRSVGKEDAVCEVCATLPANERINYTQLHPHHIIKRNHNMTRWDLRNRIWVCPRHHTLGQKTAEYNEKGWFFSSNDCWLRTNRPDDYEYLLNLKYVTRNWTLDELLVIYNELIKRRT